MHRVGFQRACARYWVGRAAPFDRRVSLQLLRGKRSAARSFPRWLPSGSNCKARRAAAAHAIRARPGPNCAAGRAAAAG